MTQELERGTIVLAPDPYGKSGGRPFMIVSNSEYPFYPHGYLGVPVTTNGRDHTHEIHEFQQEWVNDQLHVLPSYVNPWSPIQINEVSKVLLKMEDEFANLVAGDVVKALGVAP